MYRGRKVAKDRQPFRILSRAALLCVAVIQLLSNFATHVSDYTTTRAYAGALAQGKNEVARETRRTKDESEGREVERKGCSRAESKGLTVDVDRWRRIRQSHERKALNVRLLGRQGLERVRRGMRAEMAGCREESCRRVGMAERLPREAASIANELLA